LADLAYKSVTLVEQAQPAHIRGHQLWLGTEGPVELAVGLNTDSGVYTAYARVIRDNPRGEGTLALPAGVAEGTDWAAALDAACEAFTARADKPVGQRKFRELDIRSTDRAALRVVADRTRLSQVR
jgi:hypothetical protein